MTRRPRTVLTGGVLLLGLAVVVSLAGSARALDTDVARYRAGSGPRVTIRGRAFEEPRRPGAAAQPLTDTVVTLVPRSEAFLRRLHALKATSRDSIDAYTRTAAAVRRAREDYERALWEAGAADLAHTRLADADGTFVFEDLVPGEWILLGWRSVAGEEQPSGGVAKRQARRFAPTPRATTHQKITVWLRELSVAPAGSETIELTDRNVWFSGPLEVLSPGTGR